jgi:hypothetical protein
MHKETREELSLRLKLTVLESCDLPESDYAEIIRRKSTMRNFCIRVSTSVPLPRRKRKQISLILGDGLFNHTMQMENAQMVSVPA